MANPPLETPQPPIDQMSDRDRKLLARLVAKYGAEVIAEAAKKVPAPRGPGRPSRRRDLPDLKRIILGRRYEELKREWREAGSSKPGTKALIQLYNEAGGPGAFDKFLATTKRKLPGARRALKREKEMEGDIFAFLIERDGEAALDAYLRERGSWLRADKAKQKKRGE